jgi:hypothetical protein
MGPIRDPRAFPFNILPRCDRGCRPDHRDKLPVTTDFDAQDAEPGLFTVEGHALDGTREVFRRMSVGWCLRRRFHRRITSIAERSMPTLARENGETRALDDGEDAHGEQPTTPLSREQDGCAPLRVNGSGGHCQLVERDLSSARMG